MPNPQLVIDVISGPERLAQLSAILDQAFSVPEGRHFFDDFPVWDEHFETGPGELLRVGVFAAEKLVTSACVRLAKLKTPSQNPLPVALIGGVATDPSFRGQGLASQAVKLATDWAEERGVALTLLWSNEHSMYRKLGFEPCGQQIVLPISSFVFGGARTLEVHEGWQSGIFEMMKNREAGLLLETKDLKWMAAHKGVRWFWTGEAGRPSAYAALGRGIDLHGVVHEWGGDRAALLEILHHIHRLESGAAMLGGPDVFKKIGFVYAQSQVEPLALVRMRDHRVVYHSFLRPAFLRPEFSDAVFDPSVLERLEPNEVVRLFFGPFKEGVSVTQPFPLPLWIWGLDAA